MSAFDPIRELSENANAYTPLGPGDERIVTDRYVLSLGRGDEPAWNVAQRFRLDAGEVDAVRAEIHRQLRARGRTACTWEIGSSAKPGDLVERLLERGLVDDDEPLAIGMVLTEPPADSAADAGLVVRRAASDQDELIGARIAAAAFGSPPGAARRFDPDAATVTYVAFLEGEPVARATATFSEWGVSLFGGATVPHARGRGAYRALVAARWRDAASRGTPTAFTQAGRQSRPILARLGFREVCEIRILLDAFDRSQP